MGSMRDQQRRQREVLGTQHRSVPGGSRHGDRDQRRHQSCLRDQERRQRRVLGQQRGWGKAASRRTSALVVCSPEQVATLSRATEGSTLSAMVIVAAATGLRQGELLALRWRHVRFAEQAVDIVASYSGGLEATSPKGRRRRSVPLADVAARELARLGQRTIFTGPARLSAFFASNKRRVRHPSRSDPDRWVVHISGERRSSSSVKRSLA